jgi:membrane dipeptidase
MKKILKSIFKWTCYSVVLLLVLVGLRMALGNYLHETTLPAVSEDMRKKAFKLHHDSILFDGHNDLPTQVFHFGFDLGENGAQPSDRSLQWPWLDAPSWVPFRPTGDTVATHTDLVRMEKGGLDAQFFSIWVGFGCDYRDKKIAPGVSKNRVLSMTSAFKRQVETHKEKIEMAYSSKDVKRIVSEKKIAALFGLEGGHAIEHDLTNLQEYYDIGIRYIGLSHFCSHDWADSSGDDPVCNGLSEFGEQVIREMNRLGMMVDVSHASDDTFWDTVKITNAPIIASHSSARAVTNSARNLTDDMIKAVANTEGVVMVVFMTPFIDPEKSPIWKAATGWHWFWHPKQPMTGISALVDHIDHIVKLVGIDHVGIGSDFDGVPTMWLPEGLKDVSGFPNLTIELLRRGYIEEDISKLLGGNILRVMEKVEALAQI